MVRTLLVLLRSYQIVSLPEVETFSVLIFSSLKTRMSSTLEGITSSLLFRLPSFCLLNSLLNDNFVTQHVWLDLAQ
jgi:hypothetical protein